MIHGVILWVILLSTVIHGGFSILILTGIFQKSEVKDAYYAHIHGSIGSNVTYQQ